MSSEPIDIDGPDVDGDDAGRLIYRGEFFTGQAAEYGREGQLLGLTSYVNGIPDGPDKGWYPDGTPESEGVVKYGRAVGEWRRWHPDGSLQKLDIFSDKGDLLSRRMWDENGNLIKEYTRRDTSR